MKKTKFKEEQVVAILKEQVYAGPQTAHWLLPLSHKPSPSGKSQKAVSANAGFNNDVSYLYCQVCPDCFTINNNFFDRLIQ